MLVRKWEIGTCILLVGIQISAITLEGNLGTATKTQKCIPQIPGTGIFVINLVGLILKSIKNTT